MAEYKQALPQGMFSDLISSVMICMVFSSEEDKNEGRSQNINTDGLYI